MNLTRPKLSPEFLLKQTQTYVDAQASGLKIIPLAGDASNRSYYRLELILKDQTHRTVVLMVLAEPEPFKQSEEKESGKITTAELPFLNIQKFLHSHGVAVPLVYYHDQKTGLIYLEDLGDQTFEKTVKSLPGSQIKLFYQGAINELIRIQECKSNSESCVAFERSFNQPLLVWEFDHFLEYGVEKNGGGLASLEDRVVFKETFNRISTILASEPTVFVHRDYHSRNLMVQGEKLRVIDFQDALLGPCQYDLASLLRDAYMTLPEDLIDHLVDFYIDQKEKKEQSAINRRQFRYVFDLVSLQRNMKAAGRFVFIDLVKKNSNFLQYVPKALKDISLNLKKYPELKALKASLVRYLPELA
ncbi:MAG: phosphotransferase [Nitrospirae bacterium]|nr:phosphotransferase [Nitrospirota bacterium]MBI3352198.1 phosphotransferase [Nitrospirota bacterium]